MPESMPVHDRSHPKRSGASCRRGPLSGRCRWPGTDAPLRAPVVHRKQGRIGDLVTNADLAPNHRLGAAGGANPGAVLAEESGAAGQGGLRWCVDPPDGTTNYATATPFLHLDRTHPGPAPILAIAVPFLKEMYGGQGRTFCNDRPLGGSCDRPNSLLVTGFAYDRHTRLDNNYAEFCWFTLAPTACAGAVCSGGPGLRGRWPPGQLGTGPVSGIWRWRGVGGLAGGTVTGCNHPSTSPVAGSLPLAPACMRRSPRGCLRCSHCLEPPSGAEVTAMGS